VRAAYRFHSTGCDVKKALRPTAALRGGIAAAGSNVSLCLKPVKRGIHGPDRYLALRPELDLLPHRNAVGPILQPEQRQKNDVLKLPEIVAAIHYFYNIDQIQRPGQLVGPKTSFASASLRPSPVPSVTITEVLME
jgi:hypothetical protein